METNPSFSLNIMPRPGSLKNPSPAGATLDEVRRPLGDGEAAAQFQKGLDQLALLPDTPNASDKSSNFALAWVPP